MTAGKPPGNGTAVFFLGSKNSSNGVYGDRPYQLLLLFGSLAPFALEDYISLPWGAAKPTRGPAFGNPAEQRLLLVLFLFLSPCRFNLSKLTTTPEENMKSGEHQLALKDSVPDAFPLTSKARRSIPEVSQTLDKTCNFFLPLCVRDDELEVAYAQKQSALRAASIRDSHRTKRFLD